jgi:hypothetical protein
MDCVEVKAEVRGVYCLKQLILKSLHCIADAALNHISTSNDQMNDCLDKCQNSIHDSLPS